MTMYIPTIPVCKFNFISIKYKVNEQSMRAEQSRKG